MAKQQSSKLVYDARQALSELGKMAKKLAEYNDKIKTINNTQGQMNRVAKTATTRLGEMSTKLSDVNRSLTRVESASAKITTNLQNLSRVSSSTATQMNKLRDSSRTASSAMQRAAKVLPTFVQALRDSRDALNRDKQVIESTVARMRQFRGQITSLTRAMKLKNTTAKEQVQLMEKDAAAMSHANQNSVALFFSFRNLVRAAANFTFFGVFFTLAAAIKESVSTAKEWSKVISEIQTISDKASGTTEVWQQRLVNLSDAFGVDVVEAAEAAYQALSNQVVQGTEAIAFMREEISLSITTVATLDEAVATTTSILNAYQESTGSASRVNSILFKTVEEGRLRLSELANTLGRVSILSSQLGISFIEQQAAITLLSRQGIKAEEAITLLRNVELKLIRPTEEMEALFAKWGFTSGEAAARTLGLVGVLNKFLEEAKISGDITAALGEQFGRLRAIVGATGLALNDFAGEIAKFDDAAQKRFDAFIVRIESMENRANVQLEQMKNFFVQDFGVPILRTMVELAEGFGGARVALLKLGQFIKQAAGLALSYRIAIALAATANAQFGASLLAAGGRFLAVTTGAKTATVAINAFNVARSAATLGLTLIINSLIQASFAAQNLATEIDVTSDAFAASMSRMSGIELQRFQVALDQVNIRAVQAVAGALQGFRVFQANLQAINNQIAEDIQARWKAIGEAMEAALEGPLERVRDQIQAAANDVDQNLDKIAKRQEDLQKRQRDEFLLRRRQGIEAANPEDPAAIRRQLLELAASIDQQALQALNTGNTAIFDEFQERADAIREEIKKDLEQIKQEAGRVKDIKEEVRRRVFDPLTGKTRIKTEQEVIGQEKENPRLEQQALEELNALELQRQTIVNQRIAAEQAFIQTQQAALEQQKLQVQAQEAALQNFQAALAKIDAFDIKGPVTGDTVNQFRAAVQAADAEAKKAGLTGKERLDFLRQARAKEIQLAREATRQAAEAELKETQKVQAEIQKRLEETNKAREDFEQRTVDAFKTDIPEAISKSLEELRQFGFTVGGRETGANQAGLVTGVSPFGQQLGLAAEEAEKLLKALITAPTFEEQVVRAEEFRKKLVEVEAAARKLEELARTTGGVPTAFTQLIPGLGFGFQARAEIDALTDSLKVGGLTLEEISQRFSDVFTKLGQANADYQATVNLTNELNQQLQSIRSFTELIPPAYRDLMNAASDSLNIQINNQAQLNQHLQVTLDRLRLIAEQQQRLNQLGGGQQGGGLGGGGGFAFGGGIDRNMFVGADGEIVMNQRASRRFGPWLHALNAQQQGLAGDTSTNLTFGDTIINVPSGTDNIEFIASELQRRARLGLFRIG